MVSEPAFGSAQVGFCAPFARAVVTHVLTRGGDAAQVMEVLRHAPMAGADQPSPWITAQTLSRALNAAVRCLGDEQAGLQTGVSLKLAHLGALGYAAMTAPDAFSALKLFDELQSQCMTDLRMRHALQGGVVLVYSHGLHPTAQHPTPADYAFWSFLMACRLNFIAGGSGRRLTPLRVDLPCPAPRCERAIREFVGAPVHFNAQTYREWFSADDLMRQNPQGSPEIHLAMSAMARRSLREACNPDDWLVTRLKSAIHEVLEQGGTPTLDSLAPKLSPPGGGQGAAMSARQLQRRLMALKRSIRVLVGEVRRERALLQLRSTDRPLADIAADAGYAELSSFHRAVRRWTGLTPIGIRKEGADRQGLKV